MGDACAADRGSGERRDLIEVPSDDSERLAADSDHSQPAGVGDRRGESRSRRAAHPGLLQWEPAPNELGEPVHPAILYRYAVSSASERRDFDEGYAVAVAAPPNPA